MFRDCGLLLEGGASFCLQMKCIVFKSLWQLYGKQHAMST